MVARLKLRSLDALRQSDAGEPAAVVGDVVQLLVTISDRSNSRGGSFRIEHPSIAGGGVTHTFEGRYGSGDSKRLLRKKKSAPDNYRGADQFTFQFTVAAEAARTEVTLRAVSQCEVTAPDAPRPLVAFADLSAFLDTHPVLLTEMPRQRLGVTRGGNQGITANVRNTVQPPVQFHAKLFFLDPEGNERHLPTGLPVEAIVGQRNIQRCESELQAGLISLSAIASTLVLGSKEIALRLGDTSTRFVLCEAIGASVKTQTWGALPPESDPTGTIPKRFFSLPRGASLVEMRCEVTNDGGRFDPRTGRFALAVNGLPTSLGTPSAPVKIVLKPVWQFLRFEYFDRHYGRSDHGGENVVAPAVTLEGFGATPSSPTTAPSVTSNWSLDPASDGKIVQCVPWFKQKLDDGTAAAKPDRDTELRFALPANTFMQSESATVRKRVIASDEQRKPGPERLKFYDLPTLWKARNYYGALSTADGEFGWYQDIASRATAIDKPIVFCLDDIVLTDHERKMLDGWTHDERLAIFAHTFDDSLADCTKHGLYKADLPDKKSWFSKKPLAGAPEESWNYLRDYPKWTRLIAAEGSLFDVFDSRSVAGSPCGDDETVGARAAVRWVDATTAPMGSPASASFNPRPGLQEPANCRHFAIQPFFEQEFVARSAPLAAGTSIDSWRSPLPSGAGRFRNGRFDIALLRCCSLKDDKEVGAIIRYHRYSFDFATADSTIKNSGADAQADWTRDLMTNLALRWNGDDGVNPARAVLKPQTGSSGPSLPIITVVQTYDLAKAHFHTKTVAEAETSSMNGPNGTGQLRVAAATPVTTRGFAAAHENGHTGGLPDDYCPMTLGVPAGSSNHMPGSPYLADAQAMMKANKEVRARYFWHVAEWLRSVNGFANAKYEISHGASTYKLPYLPTPHVNRSLVQWPLIGKHHATPTNTTGLCNTYLYLLGDDEFARTVLPGLAGGGTFDALLVVMVVVNFTSAPNLSDDEWKQVFTRCNQRVNGSLNYKVTASFTVRAVDGPPAVRRCLVHFVPHFIAGPATGATHLAVSLSNVDALNVEMGGSPRRLTVPLDKSSPPAWNDSKARVEEFFFDAFCACVGVSGDTALDDAFDRANSYRSLIKTVLDLGQNPVIARVP